MPSTIIGSSSITSIRCAISSSPAFQTRLSLTQEKCQVANAWKSLRTLRLTECCASSDVRKSDGRADCGHFRDDRSDTPEDRRQLIEIERLRQKFVDSEGECF